MDLDLLQERVAQDCDGDAFVCFEQVYENVQELFSKVEVDVTLNENKSHSLVNDRRIFIFVY